MKRGWFLVAVWILTVTFPAFASRTVQYKAEALSLPSQATAVNDRGDMLGLIDPTGFPYFNRWQPFVWKANGEVVILPGLVDQKLRACGINNHLEVVGHSLGGSLTAPYRAWVGDGTGTWRWLDWPEGGFLVAINNAGTAVGTYYRANKPYPCTYNLRTKRLSVLTAAGPGYGYGINDQGIVVGTTSSKPYGFVVWPSGYVTYLSHGAVRSSAYAITNTNVVRGELGAQVPVPTLFKVSYYGIHAMPALPISGGLTITGMNDRGDLVGSVHCGYGEDYARLLLAPEGRQGTRQLVELSEMAGANFIMCSAEAINNAGVIAGYRRSVYEYPYSYHAVRLWLVR